MKTFYAANYDSTCPPGLLADAEKQLGIPVWEYPKAIRWYVVRSVAKWPTFSHGNQGSRISPPEEVEVNTTHLVLLAERFALSCRNISNHYEPGGLVAKQWPNPEQGVPYYVSPPIIRWKVDPNRNIIIVSFVVDRSELYMFLDWLGLRDGRSTTAVYEVPEKLPVYNVQLCGQPVVRDLSTSRQVLSLKLRADTFDPRCVDSYLAKMLSTTTPDKHKPLRRLAEKDTLLWDRLTTASSVVVNDGKQLPFNRKFEYHPQKALEQGVDPLYLPTVTLLFAMTTTNTSQELKTAIFRHETTQRLFKQFTVSPVAALTAAPTTAPTTGTELASKVALIDAT